MPHTCQRSCGAIEGTDPATLELSDPVAEVAPELATLLPLVVAGNATAARRQQFTTLWQERVHSILGADPARFVTLQQVA